MRLSKEILPRLAAEHRKADFLAASLKHAYYPAPGTPPLECPAVVFYLLNSVVSRTNEKIWNSTVRAEYLYPNQGSKSATINVLEPLIEVIADHFDPDVNPNAYLLRSSTQPGMVHMCDPGNFDSSQLITWGTQEYFALIATFSIKHHRMAGEEAT